MGTPEQNPNDKKSSIPEREPEIKGFQVRTENSDLVFNALEKGVSGNIGKSLLESPIDIVSADIRSQKGNFNLFGEVSLNFDAQYKKNIKEIAVRHSVAQRLIQNNPDSKIIERGGYFVVTAPRGTKFVLYEKGHDMGDIIVSTGFIDGQFNREPLQYLPAPLSNKESFDTVMADFIDVLKITVEETYKANGTTPPDVELILQPPKINVNNLKNKGGDLDDGIKTPEDLIGRLEIEKPNITFEDIGGQAQAKKEIQGIAFALKNPDLYKKWGTRPPKGVILFGLPGTGKTLMAKALASQAEARFFHVEASDIASKWYGESEKIVKKIFDLANSTGEKVILFFDEIDAIAPQRDGSHEATHRVVSTLLENMDGMVSNSNVIVVASTNRLESIEPALLRAGRFDRWVEVTLPDKEGRKQIFDIHMKKAQAVAGRDLFDNVDLDTIVLKTEKSTGADIAEIIRRVLEEKVRQEGTGQNPDDVTTENILKEILNYERVRVTKGTIQF